MRKKVSTYLVIAGLALVCALNYQLFVFPNRFAPAGLNGICTMIQHLFHISVGYLSLLINIPLAIWIFFKVEKSIAVRSMLYVMVFSLTLLALDHVDLSAFAYETENGTRYWVHWWPASLMVHAMRFCFDAAPVAAARILWLQRSIRTIRRWGFSGSLSALMLPSQLAVTSYMILKWNR